MVGLNEALSPFGTSRTARSPSGRTLLLWQVAENEIEVLGVSVITVKRDWKFARAWLMSRLLP